MADALNGYPESLRGKFGYGEMWILQYGERRPAEKNEYTTASSTTTKRAQGPILIASRLLRKRERWRAKPVKGCKGDGQKRSLKRR